MSRQICWFIYGPSGQALPWSGSWYRKECISDFVAFANEHWEMPGKWRDFYECGYRVSKVEMVRIDTRNYAGPRPKNPPPLTLVKK